MIEKTPQTPPPRVQIETVVAALVLLACLIGAAVALTYAGMDPAAIIGLMTSIAGIGATLVGLLGRLTALHQETVQQTETIGRIDHQTNGVLTARIEDAAARAVRRVLSEPIGYLPTDPEQETPAA